MSNIPVITRAPYGPVVLRARAPHAAVETPARAPYAAIVVLSRVLSPVLPVALLAETGDALTTETGNRLLLE